MSHPDVLVRGTGAVGLAAALALARQGLRVALLGSPPEAAAVAPSTPGAVGAAGAEALPDVRAYALNAASVRLLGSLGAWDTIPAAARCAVHEMHVQGDAPAAAIDFSAWAQAIGELAWIVEAPELERALRDAVAQQPAIRVVDAEVPAALQVLAEGKDSTTRARLGVRMRRRPYGQSAIAARLASDLPHAGVARQWFRSPDVLALLPLSRPGIDSTGHGLALVWSLPTARAEALAALPDAEFEAELASATAGAAGRLSLAAPRASWPLALAAAEALHGAGWVLVGDAAHVVHPLAGQGLNLGLADVASLAEVLAAREPWRGLGDPRLLARHARRRVAPTLAMARFTDGLLHLFASPHPLVKELRNRGLSLVNQLPPLKRLLTRQALGG